MLEKIVSGGQTGVDRAALDAAMAAGVPVGGYCPRGRRAEDGCVPDCYPLIELATDDYRWRTRKNVLEADGTLIVIPRTPMTPGTRLTRDICLQEGKTFFVADLHYRMMSPALVADWIENCSVRVMNVAGPRESKSPGIYLAASEFLAQVIRLALAKG